MAIRILGEREQHWRDLGAFDAMMGCTLVDPPEALPADTEAYRAGFKHGAKVLEVLKSAAARGDLRGIMNAEAVARTAGMPEHRIATVVNLVNAGGDA